MGLPKHPRERSITSLVWIVAVAALTFAGSEGARAVVMRYGLPRVQVHRSLTASAPAFAVLLVITVVGLFLLVRRPHRPIAVALGLYSGGALANVIEVTACGGVADYIPLLGYLFSLGDVAAALGALLAYLSVVLPLWRQWRGKRGVHRAATFDVLGPSSASAAARESVR